MIFDSSKEGYIVMNITRSTRWTLVKNLKVFDQILKVFAFHFFMYSLLENMIAYLMWLVNRVLTTILGYLSLFRLTKVSPASSIVITTSIAMIPTNFCSVVPSIPIRPKIKQSI